MEARRRFEATVFCGPSLDSVVAVVVMIVVIAGVRDG